MKKILLLSIIVTTTISFYAQKSKKGFKEKALEIHNRILTIDSHTDTPLRLMSNDFDIGKRNERNNGKIDLPRMEEGGLDAAFFAVFIGQGGRDSATYKKMYDKSIEIFDAIYKNVEKYSNMAELAKTPDDAYRIEKTGKRAIYIGIENGYPIGIDTANIRTFYNMGARYITLCHSRNNDICDSANDSIEHNGVSEFGKLVIEEMNKLGMMIDVSHMSDKSFYDVIELSKAPVIASHSCSRAICDDPRNMTDSMLLKLKENDGVIQMCILSSYVKKIEQDTNRINAQNELRVKYRYFKDLTDDEYKQAVKDWYAIDTIYPARLATVTDVADHIDHMVNLIGIDHVGIGTDFDGGGGVDGCFDVSEMQNITVELYKRGYSEEDLRKIWGGNFMRVFRKVQELADNTINN